MSRSCKWLLLSCIVSSIPLLACLSPASPQQQPNARPIVVAKPDHLNFVVESGKAYASEQAITISNAGGGVLDWEMSDNALWIQLEYVTGPDNTPGNVARVTLNTAGLPAGQYTGFITIVAESAMNNPVFIPVYLNILPEAAAQQPVNQAVKPVGSVKPDVSKVVWQNRVTF